MQLNIFNDPSIVVSNFEEGEVVNDWTVLSKIGYNAYLCECKCGRTQQLKYKTLLSKQCCLVCARPNYGMHRTKSYKAWQGMIHRCENPKVPSYAQYGGRGIKVCTKWKNYNVFLFEMGEPNEGEALDRINSYGNYCKSNCQYISKSENSKRMHREYLFLSKKLLQQLDPDVLELLNLGKRDIEYQVYS